ncbi:MAG: hypothetical protein QME90_02495 [Thermodesulfobacteriota bacterium]|nr:hypothetical protein [Thermodesulfobacteriota bacterium]
MPVFQSGILDENGNVVREPAAPDVPTVLELYKQIHGKDPSGPVWEVYKLMVKTRTYGKAIVFPPGIPPQAADLLRKAAVNMVKDEKFLKESEKINPGAPHYVGEAFVRSYPKGVTGSPEVVKFMKKVLVEKYAVVVD